jgi:hypothetical protein
MLGVGVPLDSRIFRERLQGSKPIRLRRFLYHWKVIEARMSKMSSHEPFRHLKHKLWSKERPGVKLAIWLPTTKIQEVTRCPCVQVACDMPLERPWKGLQLCLRPHPNQRSTQEVIVPQSCGSSNLDNFEGLPFGSPGTKNHLDEGAVERCRVYYMGEGGGFPRVWAMVSLISSKSPMAHPNTKGNPTLY